MQDANYNVVGLVRVEPGGSATVVEQYTYSPYGQVVYADILDAEAPLSRTGFQGLFFDRFDAPRDGQTLAPPAGVFAAPTGVYCNRARVYAPAIGRFITRDPYVTTTCVPPRLRVIDNRVGGDEGLDVLQQYADGANLYVRTRANPLRFVDPNGTVSVDLAATIGFMAGYILGSAVVDGKIRPYLGTLLMAYMTGGIARDSRYSRALRGGARWAGRQVVREYDRLWQWLESRPYKNRLPNSGALGKTLGITSAGMAHAIVGLMSVEIGVVAAAIDSIELDWGEW